MEWNRNFISFDQASCTEILLLHSIECACIIVLKNTVLGLWTVCAKFQKIISCFAILKELLIVITIKFSTGKCNSSRLTILFYWQLIIFRNSLSCISTPVSLYALLHTCSYILYYTCILCLIVFKSFIHPNIQVDNYRYIAQITS